MSTVDPLEAALGGTTPEPSGAGDGGNSNGAADHPVLNRFGGDVQKALVFLNVHLHLFYL